LEKLVVWRSGTLVDSARDHPRQSHSLASRGDHDMVDTCNAGFELTPDLTSHRVGWEANADDLSPILDRDIWCE
ncbi:hypothetical protein, partial [Mycobacterium avium]